MMATLSSWRPSWWSDQVHGSAWERARDALRRDWSQTKHDLGLGGHEMNQDLTDTVKQAAGQQHLPDINHANPARVLGDWNEAEVFYRYGHAARVQYGNADPVWNEGIDQRLKSEWLATAGRDPDDWEARKEFVRKGYELAATEPSLPPDIATRATVTTKVSGR